MFAKKIISLFLLILFLISCSEEQTKNTDANEINIRLSRDPKQINPVLSPNSIAREISQYLFLPLADYHPNKLTLFPILINKIPEAYPKTIEGEELIGYDIEIKSDAVWGDGVPITNKDYAYTIRMVSHPLSNAIAWRPYFQLMKSIILDSENDKKFSVFFDKDYMLSLETALTPNILPAHIHDPSGILQTKKLKELSDSNYTPTDSAEIKLLHNINLSVYDKSEIVQNGPYNISHYESDQYYILEKKENYWGKKYENNPFLQANPSKLTFKIIPDEVSAITMAKEGSLDFLNLKESNAFLDLKEDSKFNQKWSFHVPQLMRFYYIAVNNRTEILEDKKVRRALAHLTDIDDIIENIDGGLGIRTASPFHPSKSYYNKTLTPIPFDISAANNLLSEAGWEDTNGDKVRDKIINGKSTPLSLNILITGSNLSKNIALLIQEAATKAGVKINLVSKKYSLMKKENLSTFNYDLAILVIVTDEAPDDPYGRWHSDNTAIGKRNLVGYNNPETDLLIDKLRQTNNPAQRESIYHDIQKNIFDDQPAIFLYCPLNKTMISKKFNATTTPKRPGYMANTFKLAI